MKRLIAWIRGLFVNTDYKPYDDRPRAKLPEWYQIAIKELGVKEVYGQDHNPRVLEYHRSTSLSARTDEIPWCASFVSWCLEESGRASTRSARARSYLSWGQHIDIPFVGCIVVFKRGNNAYQGHVAFFVKDEGKYIKVLGGNQANAVSIARYKKSDLLDYRSPV
jgi:uncharacterized protein (TIGR02594 family)